MPLSSADAAHLLRRVGFAGTAAEIAHFTGREREDVVDEILALSPPPPERPDFARTRDVWPGIEDFRIWWVQRMVNASWVDRTAATPSPLIEKLTLFWHGHFATGVSKVEDLRVTYDQHHLLRTGCLSPFGDLLTAVCTNGALLVFLDNHFNTVELPQENFARELMELYTIGPEEFTEHDVVEMTRAWTGHGTIGWVNPTGWNQTYEFHPDEHDSGTKTIFGQSAAWSGPDTLSLFVSGVRHDATARFLATKLWRFFVDDNPTSRGIADLMAALGSDLDIAAMMRALLLHDAFWAPAARRGLVRSPLEFAVDALRRTGIAARDSGIVWQMEGMGHALLSPPSVAGWGTNGYWVNTMTMWGKARFVDQLRWNEAYHSQFEDILEEPNAATAAARILTFFGIEDPSPETQEAVATFWRIHGRRDEWAAKHNAVVMATLTPEFQVA